jgi:hypothetical protein
VIEENSSLSGENSNVGENVSGEADKCSGDERRSIVLGFIGGEGRDGWRGNEEG